MTTLDRYRSLATEADMLAAFADVVDVRGGVLFHVRKAQGQALDGLPDLLIVLPPVLALFELKTQTDRVSLRQSWVLDLIGRCERLASGIVRPVPKPGELSLDDALRMIEG